MPRTRIKICGITRPEDAALAADLGADAIGLNFFAGPRKITIARAAEIVDDLLPLMTVVGLLTGPCREIPDPPSAEDLLGINSRTYSMAVRVFQFYGDHTYVLYRCGESDWRNAFHYWAVVSVKDRAFPKELARFRPGTRDCKFYRTTPQALVLDTAVPGQLGGTGQTFNWHWIAEARAAGELTGLPPIILAGGLTPDNVADAIRIARPYAVDVSSGVELPGKPGIKDPARLRAFIAAVHSTDTP